MNILAKLTWAIAVGLTGASWGTCDADATPDIARSAEKLATSTCAACHGVGGRSTAPTFPKLAAQTAPYLSLQLHAFRDQTRGDPDAQAYMWGMASQLNDEMIEAISTYYAAQTPSPAKPGDAKLLAPGKAIFEKGISAQGTLACITCHGAGAGGNAAFPRLAGQHAAYLVKQMLVIQNALRSAPVMHGVIKDLTPDQMRAVALYLESVGP